MDDTIQHIKDARASPVCYRRHPCTFNFHDEARLLNLARAILIDEVWKNGYDAHEPVLGVESEDGGHVLLGGTHRTIAAIFNFTCVTEKVVHTEGLKDKALLRMVQFSEPVSSEWTTVAQYVLFPHFLDSCEGGISAVNIIDRFLGPGRSGGKDMRHILFTNRFKSDSSVKRFVNGVRFLRSIGWFPRLEHMEANGLIKWNVTHILSVGLLSEERTRELLEESFESEKLGGARNPFY